MNMKLHVLGALLVCSAFGSNCAKKADEAVILAQYPLDTIEGVLTDSLVILDAAVSSDGGGALRIDATQPVVVRLFETGDIDVEDARLIYQARLKTNGIDGKAYLEMWCHFPGKGEFFSRGLQSPLTGTVDWVTEEIPFFLKKGENPDNVKLNLVVDGTGTVWIDEIRLMKARLGG